MSLVFSGGGSSTPTQTADNLRSEDTAELLLGLCEGPIMGLENEEKSFYIESTPLENSDGSKNFDDFTLEIKQGDASQDESITFQQGGVGRGHSVNLEIKKNTGTESYVSRVTDSADIDYIDVRIGINALYSSSDDGDTYNAEGKFKIQYKKNIESQWNTYQNGIIYIRGKTTSPFYKDYRISVERDPNQDVRYEIRVVRVSEPSSESTSGYFFQLYFVQYEEIDAAVKEFKNTALAHINIRTSDQINSIPQMYGVYKLLKIKIPSNYDPINHTYNGLWDGTFKIDWTDNPAWCLYDLIVNDRYGVNAYYPVIPDKWDFYEAGKYCDEMVDNGKGGLEPRYTFNYLITESQSGPDMLNYIASTFNAILYEDSMGLVRLAYEDNNKQAVQIFNPANITSGGFSYSFTDPSARYNDLTVTFINPNLVDWEEDRRRVTTPYGDENQLIYGRIPYDFNAIGCIKESEALRKARFKLITSLKETMSVTFSTNRAAMNVNLFDTILVADPDMMYSQTGRIKSISEDRSTIYLRDYVFLEASSAYELNIQTSYNVFKCNVISEEVGKVKELRLDNSLPDNIDEKAVFTLSGTEDYYGNPKPFRVMSISENQGDSDQITIVASEIYRLKQEEADTGIELYNEDYYNAPNISIIPQIIDANFKEYFDERRLQNALQIGATLPWDSYPYYTGNFVVYSRLKGDDNPTFILENLEDGNIIYDHAPGLYEFKILPLNTLGMTPSLDSAPIFEFNVSEVAADPPLNVSNFKAQGNVENIYLTWDKIDSAVRYEIRLGSDWDTADIVEKDVLPSSGLTEEYYYTSVEDDNSYTFLIKAVNSAGLYSDYAAIAYGSLAAPKKVKKFYITPNLDSLRFDWESENENYVSYEVRTGSTSWDSATLLFKTQGNNQTVLNPGFSEDTYFYIKAVSRKGIYSEEALWGKIKQNLKQNRNVILKVDNAQGELNYFVNSPQSVNVELTPWFGVTHGLTDAQGGTKIVSNGYSTAEHFFPITIPNSSGEDTIARNWYDVEFFRFGARLKWEDLTWAWNSEEAKSTSWLNADYSSSSDTDFTTYITTAKKASEYGNYLGLRFNSTTSDVTGNVTPSLQYKIEYLDGKYDKALAIYKAMKLNYTLADLPEEFSFRFKVYLNPAIPNYVKLVRFSNASMSNYIDVYFEDSNLKVVRSDGVSIIEPFSNASYLDYMFVMITQTDEKLYLDYLIEYANIKKRLEVDCQPLGTFTKLYFGSRYD